MPEPEPMSGFWEANTESWLFGPASAQTLSMLQCLKPGVATSWFEILHESSKRQVMLQLSQAALRRAPFTFEARIQRVNGTPLSIQVVGDSPAPHQLRGFMTVIHRPSGSLVDSPETEREVLESQRQDAETQHRLLFEGIPLPIIAYDCYSRRVVDVNQQAVDHYGYSKEEFLGMGISDLSANEMNRDTQLQPVRSGAVRSSRREERHVRKDGTQIDVEVSSHVIRLKDTATRVLVIHDITEAKRASNERLVSNERLQSLSRVTGAVVGSLPLEEQARVMAEQVRSAFGVDACVVRLLREGELHILASVGISKECLLSHISPEIGLPTRVFAEGKAISVYDVRESPEAPRLDTDLFSQYAFISYAGAPLVVKGRMFGLVGLFTRDFPREFTEEDLAHLQIVADNMAVTVLNHELYEQLDAQRSTLAESEERLRLVTEASSDAIWEWDRSSNYITWSDRVHRLLGLSHQDLPKNWAEMMEVIHPEDRRRCRRSLGHHRAGGGQCRVEIRLRLANGSFGVFEAFAKLVYDSRNRPVRMVGSIHDISDRIQRDVELTAVAEMSLALREAETTTEMLPIISEQISKSLALKSLVIALADPHSGTVEVRHASGVFERLVGLRLKSHEGLIGNITGQEEAKVAEHFKNDLDSVMHGSLSQPTAILGVPLVARGEVIGVLWLGKQGGPHANEELFGPSESRLLGILAEIAAASLKRAALRGKTEFHLNRLHSISLIHSCVSGSMDLRETLDMLLVQLQTQTGIDAAAIHLVDDATGAFELQASIGLKAGLEIPPMGRDLILNRSRSKLIDLQEHGAKGRRFATLIAAGYESYLAVPLIANEKILGVLEIFHGTDLPQNVDLDNFAEMLTAQAAIAVDNTNLLKSLRAANNELTAAYDATIEGWARALDLRDHETEGHTRRVTEMTVDLAKILHVPPNEIAHMRRGALLHDIGKMAIPDNVLLKKGELDASEWVVMRRHPGIALDLLAPVNFLKPAIDIPFCHHEKWDGTGYPRGLKGKQIPLSARIFAVIDVWDALISDRPYRKGWAKEQAVHYIRCNAGHHFDPEIVEAFLENLSAIDRWVR